MTDDITVTEARSPSGFPYQIIEVPNEARAETGPIPPTSPRLREAEAALAAAIAGMSGYVPECVARANVALAALGDGPDADFRPLYAELHELRGIAQNFGHPLVGVIANEACKVLDRHGLAGNARLVVGAHVQALAAIVAHANPHEGEELAAELSKSLDELRARKLPAADPA